MASNGYEVSRPEVVSNMTPEEAEEAKKIKARSSLELGGVADAHVGPDSLNFRLF